jgi:hypothetical protein
MMWFRRLWRLSRHNWSIVSQNDLHPPYSRAIAQAGFRDLLCRHIQVELSIKQSLKMIH